MRVLQRNYSQVRRDKGAHGRLTDRRLTGRLTGRIHTHTHLHTHSPLFEVVSFEALPWQATAEEVDQHVAARLDVIPATLLLAKVCVDAHVSRGAGQAFPFAIPSVGEMEECGVVGLRGRAWGGVGGGRAQGGHIEEGNWVSGGIR